MQPKILVIGSRDHNRATCIDWLQPFPNIEECNSIIINLQSLTQQVYDKNISKISQMRQPIKTIFETDREIFCIINKLIYRSQFPPPLGVPLKRTIVPGYIPNTNYDWFPIKIKISDRKKGTSISVSNHRFDKYFQCVDRWNLEISSLEAFWIFVYDFVPIAENISKKMIGATLKHGGLVKTKESGKIHLLPPPTKCDSHQAIEIILDIICGKEEKIIPSWRKDIKIPEIEKFEHKIEQKFEGIKKIQQEIMSLNNQLREWDSYKDLLSTTGDDLENIVQKTLSDIGIKTKKAKKGFHVDLISKSVAVEITGIKGTVGTGTRKVNQTGIFNQKHKKDEKIVLIANTQMNIQPNKRKEEAAFSTQVVPYFEAMGVCCLTTKTLFLLWKDVKLGKINAEDVKRKIMTKNGELRLVEFY